MPLGGCVHRRIPLLPHGFDGGVAGYLRSLEKEEPLDT